MIGHVWTTVCIIAFVTAFILGTAPYKHHTETKPVSITVIVHADSTVNPDSLKLLINKAIIDSLRQK